MQVGVFERNNNWFIDFYAKGRRIREKVGPSKGDAIRALTVRKAQVALGKFNLIPRASIPTFKALANKYQQLVSVHKRGAAVEHYIIRMLVDMFGKFRIDGLTAEDAERFKTIRSRQVKPATVNREMTVLKHMMSKALGWKYISRNPFLGVKPLEVIPKAERILSWQEEGRLLAACKRVRSRILQAVIILALNTGMRRGELLSLQWNQLDMNKRTIRIFYGKTKSAQRTIPMNVTVFNLLSELQKTRKSQFVFSSNRKPGERVLDLKKGFKKAVRLAKLETKLRFHDLRHTFATRLMEEGTDIVTVQRLLGHARISMTARYAHSSDETRRAAVGKLDRHVSSEGSPRSAPERLVDRQYEFDKPNQVSAVGP